MAGTNAASAAQWQQWPSSQQRRPHVLTGRSACCLDRSYGSAGPSDVNRPTRPTRL
jgi:hypothetical protein